MDEEQFVLTVVFQNVFFHHTNSPNPLPLAFSHLEVCKNKANYSKYRQVRFSSSYTTLAFAFLCASQERCATVAQFTGE